MSDTPEPIDQLFERFSKRIRGQEWPAGTPTERIAWDMAEEWDRATEPGEGRFFDFSASPELHEPVIQLLIHAFGWTLERPGFIRKPGGEQDQR